MFGQSTWIATIAASTVMASSLALNAVAISTAAASPPRDRAAEWTPKVRIGPPASGYNLGLDAWVRPDREGDVIWATGHQDVFVSRRSPTGQWARPLRIGHGSDTHLAGNARGDVAAVWLSSKDAFTQDVVVSRRRPGGIWTRPHVLFSGVMAGGTDDASISIGPRGRISVAFAAAHWARGSTRVRVYTYLDRWLGPKFVGGAGAYSAEVVTRPSGRVLVAWLQADAKHRQIRAAQPTSTGWRTARLDGQGVNLIARAAPDGRVYLMTNSDVWSAPPHGAWRHEPVPGMPTDDGFDLAAGAQGRAVVLTNRLEGPYGPLDNWTSVRATDGSWCPRLLLRRQYSRVTMTPSGTAYLVSHDPWVRRRPIGGPWHAPVSLDTRRSSTESLAATNARGDVVVAWTSSWRTPAVWASWRSGP